MTTISLPRNCTECGQIPNLLTAIDCKITMEADKIYQNIRFMLNEPIDTCLIKDLLHYKRILTFRYANNEYASLVFPLERIISRVRSLTTGVENCSKPKSMATPTIDMLPTSSTTTTTITTQ